MLNFRIDKFIDKINKEKRDLYKELKANPELQEEANELYAQYLSGEIKTEEFRKLTNIPANFNLSLSPPPLRPFSQESEKLRPVDLIFRRTRRN
jgi:hypothetical protein